MFDIKPALDKIRQFLYQVGQTNIYYWLSPAGDLKEFLSFLSTPVIKLSQMEVNQIAQTFLLPSARGASY